MCLGPSKVGRWQNKSGPMGPESKEGGSQVRLVTPGMDEQVHMCRMTVAMFLTIREVGVQKWKGGMFSCGIGLELEV